MHPPLPLQLRQTAAVIILITCRLVACIEAARLFSVRRKEKDHAFFDDLHPAQAGAQRPAG